MATTALWTWVDIHLNKSVGRSVRELLAAIENPNVKGKRKSISMMTPLMVPIAGMDHVVGAVDPVWRRVPSGTYWNETMDQWKKRVPGMSRDLFPSIGFFGEEQVRYGGGLGMLGYMESDPNAVAAHEIFKNDVNIRYPNQWITLAGFKFNLDEDINPDNIPQEELDENPNIGRRGYAYYRFSKIRGGLFASGEGLMYEGPDGVTVELNSGVGLNGYVKRDQYKNSILLPGPPNEEGGETTRGDLIRNHMNTLNGIAKLLFEREMMDTFDLIGLKERLQEARKEAGQTGFIPGGNARQMQKITEDEAAENKAYLEQLKSSVSFTAGGDEQ